MGNILKLAFLLKSILVHLLQVYSQCFGNSLFRNVSAAKISILLISTVIGGHVKEGIRPRKEDKLGILIYKGSISDTGMDSTFCHAV